MPFRAAQAAEWVVMFYVATALAFSNVYAEETELGKGRRCAGMRNPAGAAANEAKLHPTSVLIDRRTGRKWRLAHRLTHSRACR